MTSGTQSQHGLVVGARAEGLTVLLEPGAQTSVVVHLAVSDQPEIAVGIVQGLLAALEVDDGEPSVAEPGPADLHGARAVGAPVRQAVEHPFAFRCAERAVRDDDRGHGGHGGPPVVRGSIAGHPLPCDVRWRLGSGFHRTRSL